MIEGIRYALSVIEGKDDCQRATRLIRHELMRFEASMVQETTKPSLWGRILAIWA